MFRIFRAAYYATQAEKVAKLGQVDLAKHYKARSESLMHAETEAQKLAAAKAEIKAKYESEIANLRR